MELIPESLSIYNPGWFFLNLSSFVKAFPEDVETWADLNLLFFPKSNQEFITGVWNWNLWPCIYMQLE